MNIPFAPRRVFPIVLCAFLFFSVIWKGGKALDAAWLLTLVACVFTIISGYVSARAETSAKSATVPLIIQLPAVAFLAATFLSFLFSTTRNYGFDEVLQTASLVLLFLWVIAEGPHLPKLHTSVARTLACALLIACGIGIAVYVFQPVTRFVGTFFDYRFHTDYWPNAWGEFVLLAWPMLAWSLFQDSSKKNDVLKSIILGLVLGCLFLSFSRGSILAFFGQLSLLTLLSWRFLRQWEVMRRVLQAAALSVITGFFVFTACNHLRVSFYEVESVAKKATFQSGEGASSFSERKAFFQQAFILAKQRPLVGLGPYSFRFVQPHLQTDVLATSDHPHNVFLKIAMERGVPALAFFVFLLAVCLLCGLRASSLFRVRTGSFFVSVALTSVAGVVAHNLIDYNLQFVGIALPFWLLLGFLVSERFVLNTPERRSDVWLKVLIAVIVLALAAAESGYLVLSSFARHAEAAGDEETALAYYRKTDASLFPRDAWLSRAVMLLNARKFIEAENAAVTYIAENSEDARGWRLLGDIYLAWNKRVDAIRAYEKAYDYGKANDAGIIRGLVFLLKSDRIKLNQRRHEIDSLLNDYGYAIEHNTHFIALGSNVEEAVSLAELLAQLYPAEADVYLSLADRMTEHASEERSRLASRPRGMLW